jgi:hypothetical protein
VDLGKSRVRLISDTTAGANLVGGHSKSNVIDLAEQGGPLRKLRKINAQPFIAAPVRGDERQRYQKAGVAG